MSGTNANQEEDVTRRNDLIYATVNMEPMITGDPNPDGTIGNSGR